MKRLTISSLVKIVALGVVFVAQDWRTLDSHHYAKVPLTRGNSECLQLFNCLAEPVNLTLRNTLCRPMFSSVGGVTQPKLEKKKFRSPIFSPAGGSLSPTE